MISFSRALSAVCAMGPTARAYSNSAFLFISNVLLAGSLVILKKVDVCLWWEENCAF